MCHQGRVGGRDPSEHVLHVYSPHTIKKKDRNVAPPPMIESTLTNQ